MKIRLARKILKHYRRYSRGKLSKAIVRVNRQPYHGYGVWTSAAKSNES